MKTLTKTVRPTLKAGYAFEWEGTKDVMPGTRDWDISVLLAGECESASFRGGWMIDGSLCDIFYAGEVRGHQRYFAQCQTVTRYMPNSTDLTEEQISELADEHAEACFEDDGAAAYGRDE